MGSTKDKMLAEIDTRYFSSNLNILKDPMFVIPTLLDPRYKFSLPNGDFQLGKAILLDAAIEMAPEALPVSSTTSTGENMR